MLEAVVALPDQLFYNTGISTYFWVVTNRKAPRRRGKIQLLDARDIFTKTRKSLGQKRKELSVAQIDEIARMYGDFEEGPLVKIFPNEAFGFLRITVERPLRLRWEITDDTLLAVESLKAVIKLDSSLRDASARCVERATGQFVRHREVGQGCDVRSTRFGRSGQDHRACQCHYRSYCGARPRGPDHHRPLQVTPSPILTFATTRTSRYPR